ncbi:glycine receptor subunit alpha-4-like isoform X2 [Ornithodoros turicata]
MYMFEQWRDSRLADVGDPSPGVILPTSIADRLWTPTIAFDNAKRASIATAVRRTVLFKDKNLLRITRYHFDVQCDIDVTFFPLDVQRCPFTIRCLFDTSHRVKLQWTSDAAVREIAQVKSIVMRSDNEDSSFSMETPVTASTKLVLPSGTFSVLNVNFTFRRELTSQVFKKYLPSSLVVMLSWAGFWIDIAVVPARVILGITSVLTIVTQITQAFDVTYVTFLDLWLFTCELMVIAAVLEFVVAYTMAKPKKQPAPAAHTAYDISATTPDARQEKNIKKALHELLNKNIGAVKTDVDGFCQMAFPITFLAFVVWYWAMLVYFTMPRDDED